MASAPAARRTGRVPPLAAALGALAAGILLSSSVVLAPPVALALLPLCLLGAVAANRLPVLRAFCLLLPFALFGLLHAQRARTPGPDDVSRLVGRPSVWVRGVVASHPEPGGFGSFSFVLRAGAVRDGVVGRAVSGNLRVTVAGGVAAAASVPQAGDLVAVRGRVALPKGASNPGEFDYRAYLARRGVFAALTAKRAGDLKVVGSPGGGASGLLRERVRGNLARHLNTDDAALVGGILLSDRARLPADLEDALTRTGAVHILSVSGLHLAALAGVLLGGLSWLPARPGVRTAGRLAALLLLWTYALAAGGSAAAVRAAWMASVFLCGPLLRRHADPVHSLVFAAFALLVVSPLAIYDAGTQLSFATVGALLLWVPPLARRYLPWEPGMNLRQGAVRWVCLALLAGGVAHAGSSPLAAYHFGTLSLVAPLANLLLVPVSEAILLVGLADGLLGLPLGWVLHPLAVVLRGLAMAFAAPDWAAVSAGTPPGWLVAAFYVAFLGGAIVVRRRLLVKSLFAPPGHSAATVAAVDRPGGGADRVPGAEPSA